MSDLRQDIEEELRAWPETTGGRSMLIANVKSMCKKAADEIASLRAQLDNVKYHYGALSTAYEHAQAQLTSARKALEPFASASDGLLSTLPDSYCIVLKMDAATPFAMIKVGELRAAKTALF